MTNALKTGVVTEFKDEYFFLSNFYAAPFSWRGTEYASAEHAFQSAKAWHIKDSYIHDMAKYQDKIQATPTPAKAKYEGRSIRIDVDSWNAQRVWYMREIIHAKFSKVEGLAGQLINTGAMMLVEGNDWKDFFWGRCEGKGLNTLGVILMETRGYWLLSDFKDRL